MYAALRLYGGQARRRAPSMAALRALNLCRSSTRTLISPTGTTPDLLDLVAHLLAQVGRDLAEVEAALHDDVQADVGPALVDIDLHALAERAAEEARELAYGRLLHADHPVGGAGRAAGELGDDLVGDGDGRPRAQAW